jgi:hypothetical protein
VLEAHPLHRGHHRREGRPGGNLLPLSPPHQGRLDLHPEQGHDALGTSGYKAENDVLRVPATVTTIPAREHLAFEVLDFTDDGGTLALEWDTLRVGVKFELATRAAVLSAIQSLKTDDWRQYANAARYLLESRADPALAMQLADRSIALKEDWYNLWVKAQLLAASGNKADAVKVAQRSQELGRKAQSFPLADDVARAIADWKK